MIYLSTVTAVVVGYLIGSFPTAWLVGRHVLGKDADVRVLGDGNVGATNIGRLIGARWGTFVGAVDIAKGFVAVSVFDSIYRLAESVEHLGTVSEPGLAAGVACVVGHIWPIWLRFRGGRGAAAAIGVLGAVFTAPVLLLTLPTALVLLVTRNTSIAFCTIYYWSLIVAKIIFGAAWTPILCCYFLSYPVLLTDPRLQPFLQRTVGRLTKKTSGTSLQYTRKAGEQTDK